MLHNTNRNHVPDNPLQNVLSNHQNQLFECYSKLLMLRVDFAYRQESDSFNAADVNQLVADMTWLTEQCTTLSGLVGYAWVLEYGEDHRYHVHAAFYLNGQRHRKVWCFWEAIHSLWEVITDGEGYAHRCEPKGHYRVRGERVISFSDNRGREGMQYILSYMGKQSQRTERRIYRVSVVPLPAVSGRRRKYS
ncbi:rolling circle replication-associated protein [Enterobacter cloacae]|uniref:rolling circle replication-associated protein n=1 Tax=Enterobacter cloacae TaxID=550 RepID=UPI0021D25E7C|nr:inovirus-type Gp2 protein [Enterobacter cloacae]MCU6208175.1 inovirus-type Gp2 protein [Enterobacter cloacae]